MIGFILPAIISTIIITAPSSNTVSIRQEINTTGQVNQRIQVQATARGQQVRATIQAQRRELVREYFRRMIARFEAAINRLEKLIERLEARMDKINYEDRTSLNDAKTKLDAARIKIQSLKDGLEDILSSQDPKAAFKKVGQDIRGVKKDLVEIHRILVHIIGDLKGLRVGNED